MIGYVWVLKMFKPILIKKHMNSFSLSRRGVFSDVTASHHPSHPPPIITCPGKSYCSMNENDQAYYALSISKVRYYITNYKSNCAHGYHNVVTLEYYWSISAVSPCQTQSFSVWLHSEDSRGTRACLSMHH